MKKDFVLVLPIKSCQIEKLKTMIPSQSIYSTVFRGKFNGTKAFAFCVPEEKLLVILENLHITKEELKPVYYSIKEISNIKLLGFTMEKGR